MNFFKYFQHFPDFRAMPIRPEIKGSFPVSSLSSNGKQLVNDVFSRLCTLVNYYHFVIMCASLRCHWFFLTGSSVSRVRFVRQDTQIFVFCVLMADSDIVQIGRNWPVEQERVCSQISIVFFREHSGRIKLFVRNAFKILYTLGSLAVQDGHPLVMRAVDEADLMNDDLRRGWLALQAAFNDSFDADMFRSLQTLKKDKVIPPGLTTVADAFFGHLLKTEIRFMSYVKNNKELREAKSALLKTNGELKMQVERAAVRETDLKRELFALKNTRNDEARFVSRVGGIPDEDCLIDWFLEF